MATQISVGTFNLNNLFSRFNFSVEISAVNEAEKMVTVEYDITDPTTFHIRSFKGTLVKGKDPKDTDTIAARLATMNLDVVAVQEVEDIMTLTRFDLDHLKGRYPHQVLVEGNDDRLIDVAVYSKFPIGAVTSWRHAVHPDALGQPVFSRDLLQVEILTQDRADRLFTLFNTHMKSQLVLPGEDPVATHQKSNLRRQQQAEVAARIIGDVTGGRGRFIVVGDMNDTPDSPFLKPLVGSPALNLTNALQNPKETRPPKHDVPMPTTKAWTHRFKEAGKPARYELYDQIWLSHELAGHVKGAFIDRRTKHSGDGSDHDPAWVVLTL